MDVRATWAPLRSQVIEAIDSILEHGSFVNGPPVAELESALATRAHVPWATVCSSGTTALQLALMALEIVPGDEVIVPAFTFAAPLEAVLLQGATPVLVDVDATSCTIDVELAARAITPRTRAIIAVSLYGQPADFDGLRRIVADRDIVVIDDAAQSFGASVGGRPTGSLADITCTSFFPTKPLGGIGEGGAVLTADETLAARVTELRDHGQSAKYVHSSLGFNARLDSINCAALLVALEGFDEALSRRNVIAQRYDEHLDDLAADGLLVLPAIKSGARSAFALYTVQVAERERVINRLLDYGVGTAVHYPSPLYRQPAFQACVSQQPLPVSEHLAAQVLCLPLYPTLTAEQQDHVARTLKGALRP